MLFSNELLNEACRETTKDNKMDEDKQTKKSECFANVFNSVDFGKFLNKELPKTFDSGNIFLSKDSVLPIFDSSAFRSKDAFSNMFASSDWEMKLPNEDIKPSQELPPLKTMSGTIQPDATTKKALADALTSKDWMPMSTLGSHVDVSYSRGIFAGSDSETSVNEGDLPVEPLSPKTDWDTMFFSQLQLFPPPLATADEDCEIRPVSRQEQVLSGVTLASSTPARVPLEGSLDVPPQVDTVVSQELSQPRKATQTSPSKATQTSKKRKRKPRKKVVPDVKIYVEPLDFDVLLGRGGRSNHHPGNKRYREEVTNLQSWYLGIEDKDEKTDLSQCLVDYVHSYQGRFLEKDEVGWFVIPNIVARRKASQALREDNDAAKRAGKRARYLKKKEEAQKQQPEGI
jgi:hypothetical protein